MRSLHAARLPLAGLAALAAASAIAPGHVCAQDAARPTATAVRTGEPMHVDARFTERAWQEAPAITAFTQNDPREGEPVSQRTVVRLAYDADALYVAAWLYDEHPVQRRLARRDAWLEDSDWFSISLDSFNDRLTAWRFQVNPAGVRADEALTDRGDDESWDPVWEAATAVTDSGWVAELRIPFSQLRFSRASVQEWGLQLERTIARLQEEAVFAFTPKRERGGIARYGRLVGLRDIDPGHGFELTPYVVSRAELERIEPRAGAPFENPYRDGSDLAFNAGADLKYRVAPNVTLDLTVNPDFGQVELDPAVINLSAFETRFDERRPFFVEGRDIFSFGGETQPFYSRRIGGRPNGVAGPAGTLYSDAPESASILGAAKLTGRSRSGWVFGVLDAVTGEERTRFALEDGTRAERLAAPLTNYAVGRVERSLREGQTVVGALGTAVHRRLDGTPLETSLRRSAYTAGADFRHEFAARAWELAGNVAATRIAGNPAVLVAAQRSSARYYQRPDAEHLEVDSSATTLSGYTAELSLRKRAGRHWRGELGVVAISPGYELNDVGFLSHADRVSVEGDLEYVQQQPGRVLREWNVELSPQLDWNYGGDWLGGRVNVETYAQLLSYWSGSLEVGRTLGGYSDRLTRGGPLMRAPRQTTASLWLESDTRRKWVARSGLWYASVDEGGDGIGAELRLELRPSPSWSLTLGPEYSRERIGTQYVATITDAYATHTFGRRYLFADLEQHELSLPARLNLTFQPGLSLELYAQPLIASAAFGHPKELAAPRTFRFIRYGTDAGTLERDGQEFTIDPDGAGPAPAFTVDDEDFNERSLRGNAVLRWEWRPGSTLYLVWQQVRESEVVADRLVVGRSVRALWDAPARNAFAIKVTYWFAR